MTMNTHRAIILFGQSLADTLKKDHASAVEIVAEVVDGATHALAAFNADNPKPEASLRERIDRCIRVRLARIKAELALPAANEQEMGHSLELTAESVRLLQLGSLLPFIKDTAALYYLAGNLEVSDGRYDYLPAATDVERRPGPVGTDDLIFQNTGEGWQRVPAPDTITVTLPRNMPPGQSVTIRSDPAGHIDALLSEAPMSDTAGVLLSELGADDISAHGLDPAAHDDDMARTTVMVVENVAGDRIVRQTLIVGHSPGSATVLQVGSDDGVAIQIPGLNPLEGFLSISSGILGWMPNKGSPLVWRDGKVVDPQSSPDLERGDRLQFGAFDVCLDCCGGTCSGAH